MGAAYKSCMEWYKANIFWSRKLRKAFPFYIDGKQQKVGFPQVHYGMLTRTLYHKNVHFSLPVLHTEKFFSQVINYHISQNERRFSRVVFLFYEIVPPLKNENTLYLMNGSKHFLIDWWWAVEHLKDHGKRQQKKSLGGWIRIKCQENT